GAAPCSSRPGPRTMRACRFIRASRLQGAWKPRSSPACSVMSWIATANGVRSRSTTIPAMSSRTSYGASIKAKRLNRRSTLALGDQSDQHVDARDRHPLGRLRQTRDTHLAGLDVEQLAGILAEEMEVVRRIGVEIGLGAFDRDLAQQACFRELMQRVVDGRERDRHFMPQGLFVQQLRRDMAVTRLKQQGRQREVLPRGPKPGAAQAL